MSHIPIFPCSGNRMVAVNPALVRSVETQSSGAGIKIVFDRGHELLVNASLHSVVDALWNPSPMAEIKELTVSPDWTLVNAEKERLHIADVDYFAFRKQAHDRTEVLEQRFNDEHGPAGWCAEVSANYGPQGTALAGALHQ